MKFANCLRAFAPISLFTLIAAQQRLSSTGFKGCDALIAAGLGGMLVFPADLGYRESTSSYYSSENRRLQPYCIVQPVSTKDVSRSVKALGAVSSAGNWDIAVRSGGHSDFDNNAAHRGVTIDLTFLNSTTILGDIGGNATATWTGSSKLTKHVAQIQPAARWGDVMSTLEPFNLGVTGGRSGHVGAGGLLVSGGASYHTQLWGLSCDNVIGVEVVLGDGSIVTASNTENEDLFTALKGGGNNLGIVTRFDMRTFTVPQGGAYGGLLFTSWSDLDAVNDQFVKYASSIEQGSPDHEFIVYRSDAGSLSIMSMAVATDGNEHSATFEAFNRLNLTRDMRARKPLSQIAASIADTGGSYYIPFTLTLQPTIDILKKASEIFTQLTQRLAEAGVPASVNFVFQPLPKLLHSVTPGNNILGFDQNLPSDSILFEARGTLADEDALFHGVARAEMAKSMEELRTYSASLDAHSTYLYMNYANPEQDVLGSYGEENVQFLKKVAIKYDPSSFFQRRVSGGWKISRVLAQETH
ncbi:FAD-dependent monooxygenase yanF [Colletotrichum tropicale]|nr:FAD-dependent monooxygenase yanF [Colletotrichum tropicale]